MNQWSTEPSLGRLDAGHAEHAQKALLDLGRVALEVLAHGGERRLGRGDHVVADCLLLIERVRLRRVQADVGAEVCQLLLLPQLFPLGIVRHGRSPILQSRSALDSLPVKNSVKKNPGWSVL